MRALPRINTRVPVTETDMIFDDTTLSYEIQQRTKISSDFGIISTVSTLNEASPLFVTESTEDNSVAVALGGAVTPDGNVVYSKEAATLKIPEEGVEYVVFIEYNTIGIERALSRYNKYEPKFYERMENAKELVNTSQIEIDVVECGDSKEPTVIYIDKTVNLSDPKTYTLDRLNNIVKLATILRIDTNVLTITITGSDVRPWYSPNDIFHRSNVGSGVPTDTNPHGIGLSDLVVGDLTLFDLAQRGGSIVSKDVDAPFIPGRLVAIEYSTSITGNTEIIFGSAITEDDNGTNVGNTIPWNIAKVVDSLDVQYAFRYEREDKKLTIFATETGKDLTISTIVVDAGLSFSSGSTIVVLPPTANEAIITEGIAINTLENNSLNFSGSRYDRTFKCYTDSSKTVLSNPEILGSYSIDGWDEDKVITLTKSGLIASKIQIGMTINAAVTVEFAIKLTGLSDSGEEITEILAMNVVGVATKLVTSTNLFSSISSFKMVASGADDPYLLPTGTTSLTFYSLKPHALKRTLASICDVAVVGSALTVKDRRVVETNINQHVPSVPAVALGNTYELIAQECGDNMKYVDLDESEFDEARNCTEYKSIMIYAGQIEFEEIYLNILLPYYGSAIIKNVALYDSPIVWTDSIVSTPSGENIISNTLSSLSPVYGFIIEITGPFLGYTLVGKL